MTLPEDKPLDDLLDDIHSLFGDTSVPAAVTRSRIEEVRDLAELLLDTLPEDDE